MVLERIISVKTAIEDPIWIFFLGGVISLISLIVSFIVFETYVGIFTNMLITISSLPFMLDILRYEEAKVEELIGRRNLNIFQRYRHVIRTYTYFFLGMILTFATIFTMLPEDFVNKAFEDQINEIRIIRGEFVFNYRTFLKIFLNNMGVLFLSFFFSLLFGAGAIFILSWNASVLSTAIGMVAKSIGGLKGLPVAMLLFFPHGSLEILAYFISAISGGILSVALTKRRTKNFFYVIEDCLSLLFISIILLVLAATIETFLI